MSLEWKTAALVQVRNGGSSGERNVWTGHAFREKQVRQRDGANVEDQGKRHIKGGPQGSSNQIAGDAITKMGKCWKKSWMCVAGPFTDSSICVGCEMSK